MLARQASFRLLQVSLLNLDLEKVTFFALFCTRVEVLYLTEMKS